MSANLYTPNIAAATNDVGDAVGVERRQWYVAIVSNNTEKTVADRLSKLNYESYVATQAVIRVWKNGRKARIEKVVLPTLIFIRCSERERREIVTLPYINRFMINRAATTAPGQNKPVAVIPDSQLESLRFMLGQSDTPVTFEDRCYRKGERVRVVRGNLQGLEGEVIENADGQRELILRIDILGCAKVTISTLDIESIA